MPNDTVSIYAWRGKAYLPAHGQCKSGIYVVMEPVYVAELDLDALVAATRDIMATEIVSLPDFTRDEWRKRPDTLLKATKAHSWKELARTGATYGIDWTEQRIHVDMSYRDKQGRWQNDPAKVRILPPDTPLEDVISVILADIRTRPEVLASAASE